MRIILTSKAAGGKDYFRNYLKQFKALDVSYTARPRREGEVPGYTYHYLTDEKFREMEKNGEFFESVTFNNWGYGTSQKSWDNNEVFIMTPSGVSQIPKSERAECIVVYFDIPISNRRDRLVLRSDADSTERRLLADFKDFEGFCDFDIRITNPTFSTEVVRKLIEDYERVNRS